jgi:hypothetical protein
MTAFTGTPTFSGGLLEWRVPAGSLIHEEGPRPETSSSSGRPTTTRRTRRASRACTVASTSPPTTSPDERWGRVRQRIPWALALRYFDGSVR